MVKYNDHRLDATFAALSDPTRRSVLVTLQSGSRNVTELSTQSDMSLPGFMKHLRALEEAGLLRREKIGRVVTCTLNAQPMRDAIDWLAKYEAFWSERLDALARYLDQQEETKQWPKSRKDPRSRSSVDSTSRRKRSGTRVRPHKR